MKGGSILKHELKNGVIQMYEIESIEIGIEGEIGLVKLNSINLDNPKKEQIAIPDNMVRSMVKLGILTVYDKN